MLLFLLSIIFFTLRQCCVAVVCFWCTWSMYVSTNHVRLEEKKERGWIEKRKLLPERSRSCRSLYRATLWDSQRESRFSSGPRLAAWFHSWMNLILSCPSPVINGHRNPGKMPSSTTEKPTAAQCLFIQVMSSQRFWFLRETGLKLVSVHL